MPRNDTTTHPRHAHAPLAVAPLIPGLTILAHPDPSRAGERAPLPGLASGCPDTLSRHAPRFCHPGDTRLRALEDAHISRRPIHFRPGAVADAVVIDPGDVHNELEADGALLDGAREFSAAELELGVVLLLNDRVALLLHRFDPLSGTGLPRCGLVGDSTALTALRREIRQVAPLDVPVLITGESGSGKELVARAVHDASARRERPYLTVNMAAIPPSLATAELFGATRGAFTGADRARAGYFARAHGGTLFLDEIGETPVEVQALLLRACETGEIQGVGGDEPRRVDVRLITASDADLNAAVERERFRAPLLHRLAGYTLDVPPLRARRDDVGRLLIHFLAEELRALAAPRRLEATPPGHPAWLPAAFVARLAGYRWPGNVRQLRNVARRLAIAGRDAAVIPPGQLERVFEGLPMTREPLPAARSSGDPALPEPARRHRRPSSVSDDELLAALRDNRFKLQPTATQLGLSRSSLYERLERVPGARRAAALGPDELRASHARCGGDLERMVDELQVSKDALARRLKDLGLV